MGSELSKQARRWGPVLGRNHRARIVLYTMAAEAYDRTIGTRHAGIYSGGHMLLAEALGYTDPQELKPMPDKHQKDEIRRDIKLLVEVGAIERVRRGTLGYTSEYRLLPRPAYRSSERQPQDGSPGLTDHAAAPGAERA